MNKHVVALYITAALLLSVLGGLAFAFYTEMQSDKKFLCAKDNSAQFLYRMDSDKTPPWAALDEPTKNRWKEFAKTKMKGLCK